MAKHQGMICATLFWAIHTKRNIYNKSYIIYYNLKFLTDLKTSKEVVLDRSKMYTPLAYI